MSLRWIPADPGFKAAVALGIVLWSIVAATMHWWGIFVLVLLWIIFVAAALAEL